MKIFLDANIIVSVLNKEYPLFTHTSRILSLTDHPRFTVFTSPVCLAIAFYFAEKKYDTNSDKKRIEVLYNHIKIDATDKNTDRQHLRNTAITEVEYGIEKYRAVGT